MTNDRELTGSDRKDELADILNNLEFSKDVEEMFKGVLTDESQESQEPQLMANLSKPLITSTTNQIHMQSPNVNMLNSGSTTPTSVPPHHPMLVQHNVPTQLQAGHPMAAIGQLQSKSIIQPQLDPNQEHPLQSQQQQKLPLQIGMNGPVKQLQSALQQPQNQPQLGQGQPQLGQSQLQLGYPNYSYTTDYCGNR